MNVEQTIRDCAARGWSRHHVAQHLGMRRQKLNDILEFMQDVKWKDHKRSLLCQQAWEARRGIDFGTAEGRARSARSARDRYPHHNLCGNSATIRELYAIWSEHISVSYDTVRRRIRQLPSLPGMSIYDAFFLDATPNHLRKKVTRNA